MPSTISPIASFSSGATAVENVGGMTVMMSADESLSSAYGHLMTFFEGRENLDATIQLMGTVASQSLYDSLFKMILVTVKAILTFNSKNLAHVWPTIRNCHQLAGQLCKNSSSTVTTKTSGITEMLRGMFSLSSQKPVSAFDKPSDLKVHAKFVHAIFSVLKFCIKLAANGKAQLAASTVKMVLALKTLAKCREMAEKRTAWESPASKAQFIIATRLEVAVRSLLIGFLSPKMQRVAHLLGIKDEPAGAEGAIEELKAAAFSCEPPGVFSLLSEMVLLVYCLFLKMHLLAGLPVNLDLDFLTEMVDKKAAQFPKSIVYKLAQAKSAQVSGKLDEAALLYKKILGEKAHCPFHPVAHWELAWMGAAALHWNQAIEHVHMLGRQIACGVSVLPATLEAAFRYARDDFGHNTGGSRGAAGDDNLVPIEEVIAYLELTSMLRARLKGHAMTSEGDAFQQAKQFFEESKMMIMPALDWLYRTDYIHLLTGNFEKTKEWLALVEDVVQEHENYSVNPDKYMLAVFNKGVLLKHMSRFNEATKCFELILIQKHSITERVAKHIVPKASLEIGLVVLASGDKKKAKDCLKDTAKYLTKKFKMSIIQIKLYSALSSIDGADHSLELIDDGGDESELEVELDKILKEHHMLIKDDADDH